MPTTIGDPMMEDHVNNLVETLHAYHLEIFFRGLSHAEWRSIQNQATSHGKDINVDDSSVQLAAGQVPHTKPSPI